MMARTATYDNDAIIEVARKVFMEKGPSVPTLVIAKAAGISEGLLFKRFGTKKKLFQAAMGIPDIDADALVSDLIGTGEVSDNLYQVAKAITGLLEEVFPRMMMLWSSRGGDDPRPVHRHRDTPLFQFIRAVARYLEAEMQLGRVARTDPMVFARLIEGACANYVFWNMVNLKEDRRMKTDQYLREVVDALWQGLRPDRKPASTRRFKER